MISRGQTYTVWQRLIPRKEAVTLRVRNRSDIKAGYTDYGLGWAAPKDLGFTEANVDGAVTSTLPTRRWQVWQQILDEAGAPNPRVGDVILDSSGTTWTVQSVDNPLFSLVWNLHTTARRIGA